jgi:exopolysaccharide biosynthesis polyprenyl glycosylphosphotransferase
MTGDIMKAPSASRIMSRLSVVLLYLAIDALAIFLTFYFIYILRFERATLLRWPPDLFQIRLFSNPHFLDHLEIIALMGLFLIVLLYKNGLYETPRGKRFSDELGALISALAMTLILGWTLSFLLQRFVLSRLVLSVFPIALVPVLGGWRYLKRKWVEYLIAHGYRRNRALIVGAGKMGRYLERALKDSPELGIDVVGFLDDHLALRPDKTPKLPVLGTLADFSTVAVQLGIHDIYITIPSERAKIKSLIEHAYELGINVHIVPELFDLLVRQIKFESVGSLTLLRLFEPTLSSWEQRLKRLEDVIIASLLLAIFAPVMALIALAIKLDSPGPVIYKQRRHGLNGVPFWLYKFRSMYHGADETKHRELAKKWLRSADPIDEQAHVYKLTRDERITRVGRIIRKFNLDEIPQLWNVLRGEMSLVGPRPPLPYEYEEYEEYHKKRLTIKPGITGLWQVSGLHKLSFEEMVLLDLRYINEWSIWLDFEILLRTISVVLLGKGM